MDFIKYQHLERLGTSEVDGIEMGECYVFPKIDGANASAWIRDGKICGGSRRRELSETEDNAGYFKWLQSYQPIRDFLERNPDKILYGEWLVPHSLKSYRNDAWRTMYVFDVVEITEEGIRFLHYDEYQPLLEEHCVPYVPPISKIINGSYDQFVAQLPKNSFLIKDGEGAGEGIVIKNYGFKNKYGRTTWAKLVTSEFKEKHVKAMGPSVLEGKKLVEEEISEKYVTEALVEKEKSKIELGSEGWSSKFIPRLLNTIYYSVVKEECWNFVKEHKNPSIDFKRLNHFVISRVKTLKPELF